MKKIDESSFDAEVLKSDVPVVVDFYADWCGPCKRMEPILSKVSEEYAGKVKVVKLNSDDNQQVAVNYQVRGLPTLILFKGGKEVDRKLGLQSEQDLKNLLGSASN